MVAYNNTLMMAHHIAQYTSMNVSTGKIYNLTVDPNYFTYDPGWKNGMCPALRKDQVGTCVEGCTSDANCTGKCCSNGCGRTCMDMVITTTPTYTRNTLDPHYTTTFTPNRQFSMMSLSIKITSLTWNETLLDPSSYNYRIVHDDILGNLREYEKIPGILGIKILGFRRGSVIADIIVAYNNTLMTAYDIAQYTSLNVSTGRINNLRVDPKYFTYDPDWKNYMCPALRKDQVGTCVEGCTSDANCTGKCCSNGCGRTCVDMVTTMMSPQPSYSTYTMDPHYSTTHTPSRHDTSIMSLSIKITSLTWNETLLDPNSYNYRMVYDKVFRNLEEYQKFPGILGIRILAFRRGSVIADIGVAYNNTQMTAHDIAQYTFMNVSSGKINNLTVDPNYFTYDPNHKRGMCPAVGRDQVGTCVEGCTSDANCTGKCCSNGCGRTCVDIVTTTDPLHTTLSSHMTDSHLTTTQMPTQHNGSGLNAEEISKFKTTGKYGATVAVHTGDPGRFFISSSGLPDHPTEKVNVNDPVAQNFSFSILRNPQMVDPPGCVGGGPIGITRTGVAIFNPLAGNDENAVEGPSAETFDSCDGHADRIGVYHYHKIPDSCLYKHEVNELIGVALDGFPIYGPRISETQNVSESDLDICHGKYVNGRYRYFVTDKFPYFLGCFRGRVINPMTQTTYNCSTTASAWNRQSFDYSYYLCHCENNRNMNNGGMTLRPECAPDNQNRPADCPTGPPPSQP